MVSRQGAVPQSHVSFRSAGTESAAHRDRLLHRARWIEWGGRHHIVHAVIEALNAELGLIKREVGVLRVLGDLGVGRVKKKPCSRLKVPQAEKRNAERPPRNTEQVKRSGVAA